MSALGDCDLRDVLSLAAAPIGSCCFQRPARQVCRGAGLGRRFTAFFACCGRSTALYCLFWHQLKNDRAGAAARAWPRDPDLQPHLRNRPHAAPGGEPSPARLHGRSRVLRMGVDSLDLPVHRLHPGQSRRPRFRRDPSGHPGLKDGRVLPIFPEGHIVPASGRRLDEIKPGTAYLAIHAQVPVVPAYICGTPETDEIIEALLTPSRARVIFGEPIDLSDIGPERAGDKAAQAEVSERSRRRSSPCRREPSSVEE